MTADPSETPVYEIPADALRRPWVSRAFLKYIQAQRLAPHRQVLPALGGGLLAVLAHAVMLAAALWYAGSPPAAHSRDESGPGSIEVVSNQEPVTTLILIDDPHPVQAAEPLSSESLASRGFADADLLVKLLSPDATPALDSDSSQPDGESVVPDTLDATQRGILFTRYVGQVDARIDRAWIRPRTPIGASEFQCRVLVTQDKRGNVIQTELQSCNGDTRWQLSLVQAVQSASPLPAPPDKRLFADALTLAFKAVPYRPGLDEEEYEPVAVATAQSDLAIVHKETGKGNLIEIRISGPASAPPADQSVSTGPASLPPMPTTPPALN